MDTATATAILATVRSRVKRADPAADYEAAMRNTAAANLKAEAAGDVGNMALLALGAGAAGRGAVGLFNVLRRHLSSGPAAAGPALLPLPYPIEPADAPGQVRKRRKAALFDWLDDVHPTEWAKGNDAATKTGIPWYGPAMALTGLGALGLGWKGVDKVLDARRKAETEKELEATRREFHDALLSQYERPSVTFRPQQKAAAAPTPMAAAGAALDAAFVSLTTVLATEKRAFDVANATGQLAGGYGVLAGLTSLLAGAVVYNKTRARSQRAILEKAIQQRDRRRFMQQPTEIYAVPEPVERLPKTPLKQEMSLLTNPPPEA